MNQITQSFKNIDEFIKSGQTPKAQSRLHHLLQEPSLKKNRRNLVQAAQLCRRVGWSERGVRLLNPIVRPTGRSAVQATPQERAEYAASLTLIGAVPEAIEILETISTKEDPQTPLFLAFAYFAQWQYSKAIPLLRLYVEFSQLSPYQKTVGELNLCAALVADKQYEEAKPRLQSLIEATKNNALIQINSREILAQALIFTGKAQHANEALTQAKSLSPRGEGGYLLLLEKWNLINRLYQGKEDVRALNGLRTLKKKALQQGRWELARDCDFFKARFSNDSHLARKLYFGSPHQAYRKRVQEEFSIEDDPAKLFIWKPLGSRGTGPFINTLSGQLVESKKKLKYAQAPHRLLRILCSDLYRPQRIATVFSELFAGEHYHPIYSAQRVQQVIIRLRKWLKSLEVGAELSSQGGQCLLNFNDPIKLGLSAVPMDPETMLHNQLLLILDRGRTYSVGEIAALLDLPRRSAQRHIASGVQSGALKSSGNTRSLRYYRE